MRTSGLPNSNGKVGTIGYCSGGRQIVPRRGQRRPRRGRGLLRRVRHRHRAGRRPAEGRADRRQDASLCCPLLGLFGDDDQYPTPEQVDELEAALKATGKKYEFHRYEGAGHAFFAVDRPSFRPEAAKDGWAKIFAFYGQYLSA